jgi:hypothetical protein
VATGRTEGGRRRQTASSESASHAGFDRPDKGQACPPADDEQNEEQFPQIHPEFGLNPELQFRFGVQAEGAPMREKKNILLSGFGKGLVQVPFDPLSDHFHQPLIFRFLGIPQQLTI